jgi:hypothetical protein
MAESGLSRFASMRCDAWAERGLILTNNRVIQLLEWGLLITHSYGGRIDVCAQLRLKLSLNEVIYLDEVIDTLMEIRRPFDLYSPLAEECAQEAYKPFWTDKDFSSFA